MIKTLTIMVPYYNKHYLPTFVCSTHNFQANFALLSDIIATPPSLTEHFTFFEPSETIYYLYVVHRPGL